MRKSRRILLTGGGSGGHIIPNLAVATAIKKEDPDAELLYVCSRNRLDESLLADTGISYRRIFSGKLRRYFSWRNFVDPFKVIVGFFQSFSILLSFRPDVVFSKGGFVSLPVVVAAFLLRKKIILHESDSRMGLANRLSALLATRVCVAFPGLVKGREKYLLTGNPIRKEIKEGDKKIGYQLTGFSDKLPVILVWGGSQGAVEINRMLAASFDDFTAHFQIVHVTGAGKEIQKSHKNYCAFEYLDEQLKHIYAITDLIIGRAGANSLYEIAYLEKPNIIIPLPNADQLKNAHYFEKEGASIVLKHEDKLFTATLDLWQNMNLRKKMKNNLHRISKPKATEAIARLILEL